MLLDKALSDVEKQNKEQVTNGGTDSNMGDNTIGNNTLSKKEELYKRIESIGINLDQLRDILDCEENMLISSCAGSGKTTALILKIIKGLVCGEYTKRIPVNTVDGTEKYIRVPKKIFVGTFLKTGAEELKTAFKQKCKQLGITGINADDITFSTLHAEFYAALKEMGVNVDIETGQQKELRSTLSLYGVRKRGSYGKSITLDEIKDCEGIIAYARNRIDEERYNHPLMQEYNMDSIGLKCIINDLRVARRNRDKMDFEDLQELLYEYGGKNENIVKFLSKRYDIIMLDEFQDTSQIQYEILKHYIKGCETVIAIGDDDQTIYSWRGSDISIINKRFEDDFKPQVKQLSINYRCAKNILNPVIASIEKNEVRHKKDLEGYHEGGSIEVYASKDIRLLFEMVQNDVAKGYNVGILSRTNFDLLAPAMLLELEECIDFAINKTVTMDSRVCKQVLGCMDLISKRYTREFEEYFSLFLRPFDKNQAKILADVLRDNKELSLSTIDIRDVEISTPNLAYIVRGIKDKKKSLSEIEAYKWILKALKNDVYSGCSAYAQKARDFCDFILNLIDNNELFKDMSLGEIGEVLSIILPDRLKKRANSKKKSKIRITTVHEAKGKEWDSVYIWNDTDGTFPASVGSREITEAEFEEERRVHYIAWTRAKKKLTVFTDITRMSPFLKECNVGDNIMDMEGDTDIQKIRRFEQKGITKDIVRNVVSGMLDNAILEEYNEDYEALRELLKKMSAIEIIENVYESIISKESNIANKGVDIVNIINGAILELSISSMLE